MASLAKVFCMFGLVAAFVVAASAADAYSRHTVSPADAYGRAYDAVGAGMRSSIPNDAGGPAYAAGQRDLDSSSDFQLQGR